MSRNRSSRSRYKMLVKTYQIIEEIKRNPILYHTEHPDYTNTKLKNETWNDLAVQFNLTGAELKSKWRNIKDGYNKHLRSIRNDSSDVTKMKHYVKWPWASHMEYFKPFLSFVKNYSNYEGSGHLNDSESQLDFGLMNNIESTFDIGDENLQIKSDISENSGSINAADDDPLNVENNEPKRYSVHKKIKFEHNGGNYDKRRNCSNNLELDCNRDGTELLFLAFAKTIKTFPPRNQTLLKMKISQLIMEEELKCQSE